MKKRYINRQKLITILISSIFSIVLFLFIGLIVSTERKMKFERSRFKGPYGYSSFYRELKRSLVPEADLNNDAEITDKEMEKAIKNKFKENDITQFENQLFISGEKATYEEVGILLELIEENHYSVYE